MSLRHRLLYGDARLWDGRQVVLTYQHVTGPTVRVVFYRRVD